MVVGAPSPELDAGGSELQCLQHILEPKRPKGKGAVGTVHAQVYLWIFLFPGSPGRDLEPQAPSCLELTLLGLDTRDQGWLCLALPTLILSLWHLACVFLCYLNAQVVPYFNFSNLRHPSPQPFLFIAPVSVHETLQRLLGTVSSFLNENVNTPTLSIHFIYPFLPIPTVPT